jgi:hypothetical protein
MTNEKLATRYRRLLLAYPRDYRRDRGEEIVGTLLSVAPAGRAWPTWAEAANLLRHGLRARLGRPASRSVAAWAPATALVCGLLAGAAASMAAWTTAGPLPGEDEAVEVMRLALPGQRLSEEANRDPAMLMIYGHPLDSGNAGLLFGGDGGELYLGGTRVSFNSFETHVPVEDIAGRLAAAGWRLAPVWERELTYCYNTACDPANPPVESLLTGERDGTVLELTLSDQGTMMLDVTLSPSTPVQVHAAALGAGFLGTICGFLCFGWVSRRTERREVVKLPFALAMFLWWAPVVLAVPNLTGHHLSEPHPRWHPFWEWTGQPALSILLIPGMFCALVALAIAAYPRREKAPAGQAVR